MTRPSIEARLAAAGLAPLPRLVWLEVDLEALAGNLRAIRTMVGDGVRVEPVVKADAYGHGAVPVALALEEAGADGFCVAAFDEAVELRRAGIRAPIVVLYPIPSEHAAHAAHAGIAVSTGGGPALHRLLDAAASAAAAPAAGPGSLAIEIEIETGLGRGGVAGGDVVEVAGTIAAAKGARLAGLWTHLQAVEDGDRTRTQLGRFEHALAALAEAGLAIPRLHVAASAMILSDSPATYDAVRPGLSIYGIPPDEMGDVAARRATEAGLRPVLSMFARPVRVASLPAGWGIGYGPTYVTERAGRFATLPVGYGDGWARSLSNRAQALVRGRRVPIVGNVSMDAIVADVTDVPGPAVDESDEFVLLGAQDGERITVLDVARTRTTNTWEVVTNMAHRLPRVYHAASDVMGVRSLLTEEPSWRASNSGTATSAISRSTRS